MHDSCGHVASITIRNGANAVLGSYVYTWDNAGNRTGLMLVNGTVTYSYDNLNRLTGERSNSASLGVYTKSYTYDAVGNRLDAGASFGVDNRVQQNGNGSYSYDNNGNVTGVGSTNSAS